MSQVTVSVGGRNYTLACADGQETQVANLAMSVDERLKQLGDNISASPAQNMLFAALILADELQDSGSNGARPDAADSANQSASHELMLELDAIRTERDEALRELALMRQSSAGPAQPPQGAISPETLEHLAQALEKHAEVLEAKASAS